jgi:hypothetical protein
MRKLLLILFTVASIMMIACNSWGDKYMANDKSEVYYKDGATADDAKRLGDFLLKNNYFDSATEKSVQVTKTVDTFNVKFVVDKEKVSQTENAEMLFTIMGAAISSDVFTGKPVKIILADTRMESFKEIPTYTSTIDTTSTTVEAPTNTTAEGDTTHHK